MRRAGVMYNVGDSAPEMEVVGDCAVGAEVEATTPLCLHGLDPEMVQAIVDELGVIVEHGFGEMRIEVEIFFPSDMR